MKIKQYNKIRELSEEELLIIEEQDALSIQEEIALLKQYLADTDYQAIKYAEGLLTEEEFSQIKAARQEWRRQINELELKI